MKTFLFSVCTFLIGITTNSYAQTSKTDNETAFTKANYNISARQRVQVYPNPSSTGQVSVVFTGNNDMRNDILLIDVLGQNVRQWNAVSTNRMDITNLRKGVYTLIVRDRQFNTQHSQKIIVL